MTMNLFDQFASPSLLAIPLVFIAMFIPWALFPAPSNRWLPNRLTTLQSSFTKSFTKQMFMPINTRGHAWPFLFSSLMIFILNTNLLGLLPYTFTPTTQLSLNLAMAMPLWLSTIMTGLRNQTTNSIAHLLPQGTPTPLIPALIVIETISLLIRPLALAVRLTANLTAGHLLIQLISMATMTMMPLPTIASLTFLALILLTALEIAVAMIQAYVFVLLLTLYLQENT
uniref:ATP synthase subunit a n=1 Tax=Oreophryne sp. TNHC-GDC 18615 TaxID=1933078 RepID=A0A343VTE8_9NEOB|nr:ATP synthase subunit 6 [Oreophryne sp. TNHC-GDC 18615]